MNLRRRQPAAPPRGRVVSVALVLVVLAGLACGVEPDGIAAVSQEEVLALTASDTASLILDARTPEEFAAGHVPRAVNIPQTEVGARLAEVEPYRARGVVVYCERGRRAGEAAQTLMDAGFSDVRELDGHMSGWRAAGLPVEE